MTTHTVSSVLPKRIKLVSKQPLSEWINVKLKRIQQARMIAKQRRQLAMLTSAQLRDIGISQFEANVESSRRFWDLPEHLE